MPRSSTNPSSITKKPLFKPETTQQVRMEDLAAAHNAFYLALQKRGVYFASAEDDDKFYDSMRLFLEESFNWPDHGSYN